jgi:transposase-like protein
MEEYPTNQMEFERWFVSEKSCLDYLYRIRWPGGFQCPRCQCIKAWIVSRGLIRCSRCDHQTSVTAETVFEGTRKPLQMWFRALWHVTNQKHGVSALGLQRALGLGSYNTAWAWMHKLRHAMVRPGRDRLRGVVEVDETYVGGERPGRKGRQMAGRALVLVAAQEDGERIGRIRLVRVPDATIKSLHTAIVQSVEPGSTIRTDDWPSYRSLPTQGYPHQTIRTFMAPLGEDPLPLVGRVASLLKRWLLGTHQGAVHPSHLDYYLDEFTFRFNRRTSHARGMLFYRLLQQAVAVEPHPAKSIRGGRRL